MSFSYTNAVDLAAGIAAGDFSAREVATSFLDRIAETDDQLNAFLAVDVSGALATADAIDAARARGEALGPWPACQWPSRTC